MTSNNEGSSFPIHPVNDSNAQPSTPTSHSTSTLPFTSPPAVDFTSKTAAVFPPSVSGAIHRSDPDEPSRFGHLPTPRSPSNYIHATPQTPESPLSHTLRSQYSSTYMRSPFPERSVVHRSPTLSRNPHQIMTPDSSPFAPRTLPSGMSLFSPLPMAAIEIPSPSGSKPVEESSRHRTPPSSSLDVALTLSSPFMATPSSSRTSRATPLPAPGMMSAPSLSVLTTPPTSPRPIAPTPDIPNSVGGELERLRRMMMEEQKTLEDRRPEYLRRMKRSISEVDPIAVPGFDFEYGVDRIGIMESPQKGRRLKLFQETSEESFEESLMAGGYGRYRTTDWVRQPQPLPVAAAETTPPAPLETVPPPLSEKEQLKRKRLAAFRSDTAGTPSKLYPVDLEGKGRVLLDIPNEALAPEPSAVAKKKSVAAGKRKKKAEPPVPDIVPVELKEDKPNWPDAEFPWRVRTEERAIYAKAEEEERLRWVEKFLDRESDDEDEDPRTPVGIDTNEEIIPSSRWGLVYDDPNDRPAPFRGGRGKMVPLHANPAKPSENRRRRQSYFPSDPADARAALLSKKSVRALSYRQQRRMRQNEYDSDEEIVCICRGTDDGRELVQCDECKMWFHLECINVRDIRELGREEDPWFCDDCSPASDAISSSSEPEDTVMEPVFVPNDSNGHVRPSNSDTPIFHSQIPESPLPSWGLNRIPKTPTRSSGPRSLNNNQSWSHSRLDSSRIAPTTPRQHSHSVPRAHVLSTPGLLDGYNLFEDTSFDPLSTPSRGIKFASSFATPKNRHALPVQLSPPHRVMTRPRTFGGAGFLSSTLDDSPGGLFDSPVRRDKSKEANRPRQIKEPTVAFPSFRKIQDAAVDESPVTRSSR